MYCSGSLDEVREVVESGKLEKLSMSTVTALLRSFVFAGRGLDEVLGALKGGVSTDKGVLNDSLLNAALFFSAVDSADEEVATAALKVSQSVF